MRLKGKKVGFTIIELLTVMSIIVVLISLLVPSLNAVRRYARVVRQKGQFHDIGTGLEMFSIDFDGYPESGPYDTATPPQAYCGAMKLCEAVMGQDGLGFHPDSVFRADGTDGATVPTVLYDFTGMTPQEIEDNRRKRKPTYIGVDKYQKTFLGDLYGFAPGNVAPFVDPCTAVLSDVFYRIKGQVTGKKIGMPVLYYKADVAKLDHLPGREVPPSPSDPQLNRDIYDIRDNYDLTGLDVPGTIASHWLYTNTDLFYDQTRNKQFGTPARPYNEHSYILISAGWDGWYGTGDDVYNFAE